MVHVRVCRSAFLEQGQKRKAERRHGGVTRGHEQIG